MKPDAYMPVYWNEFWLAVEGQLDSIIVGYLRAMSFVWHHNHGAGLKDDSEFLRKLCHIEKDEWESAREIIFDNDKFFCLGEDGLWHQKRIEEEWARSEAEYNAAVKGGKKRWAGISKKEHSRIGKHGMRVRYAKTASS